MAVHPDKWVRWDVVPTNKKRLLVLRGGRRRPRGSYPDLSGGTSWKTNRNSSGSQGGRPVCPKACWQDRACALRGCWELCTWRWGSVWWHRGKRLQVPFLRTMTASGKSFSLLLGRFSLSHQRGLFLCTLPPCFHTHSPFHYILTHFVLSAVWEPPRTLLSKVLQNPQVLPPWP